MQIREVSADMADFEEISSLYERSFPDYERYPMETLFSLQKTEGARYLAFYDGETLCGTLWFLPGDRLLYLFYIAVNDRVRSKGYGSRMLAWLKAEYPEKIIFLHMEPPDKKAENAAQRVRRRQFYLKNGFYDTGIVDQHGPDSFLVWATDRTLILDEKHLISRKLGFEN